MRKIFALEAVSKLLCTEKSMIFRPFTFDSTRSPPSGSAEENGREWSQKGDFNGKMSFTTAPLFLTFFSSLLCFFTTELHSVSPPGLFTKHLNQYFIETGSLCGDGIQLAIDAGFPEIYSIELSGAYYFYCIDRFASYPSVHLKHGDSAEVLEQILSQIDAPATFWLDGHYSGGKTTRGKTNTPILGELKAIANHPIKTHTILIDDIRCFGTNDFDYIELDEIIQVILQINPLYEISYEDGHLPKDILVAEVNEG